MAVEDQQPGGDKAIGRTEAFSDGVFAFAITLLVLDLKVPNLGGSLSSANLWSQLGGQWPAYLSLVTSFVTILVMWVNHRNVFALIHKSDALVTFANGLLLLLVVVVPFPTALVSEYLITPAGGVACAVYSGLFLLINLTFTLLWFTASRHHRLLMQAVPEAIVRRLMRRLLLGFPLYLAATIVAFWNAYASIGICIVLWIVWTYVAYEGTSPWGRASRRAGTS